MIFINIIYNDYIWLLTAKYIFSKLLGNLLIEMDIFRLRFKGLIFFLTFYIDILTIWLMESSSILSHVPVVNC